MTAEEKMVKIYLKFYDRFQFSSFVFVFHPSFCECLNDGGGAVCAVGGHGGCKIAWGETVVTRPCRVFEFTKGQSNDEMSECE